MTLKALFLLVTGLILSNSAMADSVDDIVYKAPTPVESQTTFSKVMLAPLLGPVSYSNADGSSNRETRPTFGAEAFYIQNHLAGGMVFKSYETGAEGNSLFSVNQKNLWFSAQGRYRIWNENFSPYASLGAGALFQTVSTQVMQNTTDASGTLFIRDIGIGLMGLIPGSAISVDAGARYFQYANTNGIDYILSIGVMIPPI